MKILKLKINLVSIITIAILVFSNIFVFNTKAGLEYKLDEGLVFDEFSDQTSTSQNKTYPCEYNASNSCFYLPQGTPRYEYNYDITPDNIEMWETSFSALSKDTIAGELSKFLGVDAFPLQNEVGETTKSNILIAIDNKTYSTESTYFIDVGQNIKKYNYPIHRFHVKIDQDVSNIEKLTIKWWFGNYQTGENFDNLKEIRMFIWTHGNLIPKWTNPSDLTAEYNKTNIGVKDEEDKIQADITYLDTEKYISEDGYLDFLVIGKPKNDTEQIELLTDYINISVETTFGYVSLGILYSDFIEPNNLVGWESVIWDSSRYSNRSGVTISILDKDSKEIKGYSGTHSPLDISGITDKKIKLKATLHSKDPKAQAYLFSWGVLYRKGSEFKDSFSNDYRLEELLGTEIKNGTIVVSNYSSEWSFFGKNSDNSRYYLGPNIGSGNAKVYWYSKENNIGGGFRSPITSEGKIYVASADGKIYVYNMSIAAGKNEQSYFKVSKEFLTIESSLGIYEDYLIIATGDPGNKNKIYALNKNNLSEDLWGKTYPMGDDTICFSSNPTIDEDRLFITSWGGSILDTAYFSSISNLIGANNKIIAIDIRTGNELWKPVRLPAASISSPAVGNGLVYTGCQNMFGPSLFAYDTETGDEVWNASLGIIGRSSPVYSDEKIFVLSNKKQNISVPGTYILTAVNANTGKTIWNMSIGQFKTLSLLNIFNGLSLNFTYKLLEGFAPISTPAYKEGTLFVLSPNGTFFAIDTNNNGTVKWKYNITNPIIDLSYYVTSPVVVGDMVYIIAGGKILLESESETISTGRILYAFKTEYPTSFAEPVWSMYVDIPSDATIDLNAPDILASPVISDNLIIVSTTDDTTDLTGSLICIGNYTQNYEGTVKSTDIHIPTSKWWNKFNANFTNSTKNKVVFRILNEDDNPLTDWFSITSNGKGYDISKIDSNVIKIYAKINNTNKTQIKSTLNSWTINWTDEKSGPVFDNSSFEPGSDGWISSDLEECSIVVEDKSYNNIKSGLDINSAKYKIGYIEKSTETKKVSDWLQATSSDGSGVNKTRIVADLAEHGLNVKKYVNITFTIKDLAGNIGNSKLFTFKTDTTKPESNISNIDDFEISYNTHIIIQANAKDTGTTGSISDIDYVSLIYQYSKNESAGSWSDWRYYGDNLTPTIYTWEFGEDLESGYYKILTIANDKAGNKEDVKTSKIVEFFFDDTDPIIKNKFNSSYNFTKIPSFNLKLYDDYSLETLYYKLDNNLNYIEFVSDETEDMQGKQDITLEWALSDDKWADFSEDQEHYIYFKLEDTAGNEYETTKIKIIKDENISQLYLDLTDFSNLKLGDTYTVKINIPSNIDVDTATLFYQFSDDNSTWSVAKQVGDNISSAPFEWSFKASNGSGYYKFYTKVIDVSGAQYTSDSEIINVTIMPILTLVLVVIAIIFILLTIFIIRKIKKR